MAKDSKAIDSRYAADADVDVGREHVGSIYAEALLASAQKADALEEVMETFDSLVDDVLAASPEFEAILASQLVAHDEKIEILDRVFKGKTSPMFLDFLKVVSRHERLDCLRAIHRQTHVQYDVIKNRVPVRLTTPVAIDDALAAKIKENIRKLIGGEPILRCDTDPELIGGAVLRVGDTVYDGSIATALENTSQQMIDRSVHEIQSRRDRFSNPAGN
ncbi:MAG: ATP synthase F1 subunit delta [Planctomycetota bacterium]|nr:ATP synthase F1 subunit delta [Planctomycetota bacterium]